MSQDRKPIEIVVSLIQQIAPLLIISKGVDPASILLVLISVCFYPIITLVINIYSKIKARLFGDKKSYSVVINKDINHHVLWGIDKHCRKDLTNFEATYVYSDNGNRHSTTLWNRIIYLSANPTNGDVITYCGTRISVTKINKVEDIGFGDKKSVCEYTLSCCNLDVLEDFVKRCSKEYIADFNKQLEDRKHKFTDPTPYKFIENKWKTSVLSVKKSFQNVFLESDTQALITKHIELLDNADYYTSTGKPRKLCVLFHGLPGCGKSSTIYAIASEFKYHIYSIKMSSMTSRSAFEDAISTVPSGSMVVFEEIDMGNFKNRQEKSEKDKDIHVSLGLSDMLDVLDGYTCLNECIIVLTTNHKSHLDQALLRPGRVDLEIEYKAASWQLLKRIIKHHFGILKLSCSFDDDFYRQYDGLLTSAKIINLCETVKSSEELVEKMSNLVRQSPVN